MMDPELAKAYELFDKMDAAIDAQVSRETDSFEDFLLGKSGTPRTES